jgi:hypothetical protein|tara:strand:- start:6762 stop:6929 length:168 start_codon:yes stop_codon:yes gene_type:complete
MPSKSKKQKNLMAAVANNPKFAKKVKVPVSVGKKYQKADRSLMAAALTKKGGYAG